MSRVPSVVARTALLLTLLALAAPAAAVAQQSPFQPLPPAAPDTSTQVQAPPPTTTSSDTSTGGLGTMGDILIYGTGAALLAAMAWLILRDTRRRAPVEEREAQPKGTRSPQRHARARAKAKAGRAQRRRNRANR